jgi:hypothetical protein
MKKLLCLLVTLSVGLNFSSFAQCIATPPVIKGPASICAGAIVTYTAELSTNDSFDGFNWILPSGVSIIGPQIGTSVQVYWPSAGAYQVKARLNACPNSPSYIASFNVTVVNGSSPPMPVSLTGPVAACAGTSGTYFVDPIAGYTVEWALERMLPLKTAPYPTLTPSGNQVVVSWPAGQADNYTLYASYKNGTCSGQQQRRPVQVSMGTFPVNLFLTSDKSCHGESQSFTAYGDPLDTYTWTAPAGGTLTFSGNQATVVWNTQGSQTLSVSGWNSCSSTSRSSSRTVSVGPARSSAPSKPVETSSVHCVNAIDRFTVSPVAGATSYRWNFSGQLNLSSSTRDPFVDVTFADSGTYNLTVQTSNDYCESVASEKLSFTIFGQPSISLAGTPSKFGCTTSNTNFSVTALPQHTYYWYAQDGSVVSGANTNAVSIQWASAGMKTVSVHATSPCGVMSSPIHFFVEVATPSLAPTLSNIAGVTQACNSAYQYSVIPENVTELSWTITSGGTITLPPPGPTPPPGAPPMPGVMYLPTPITVNWTSAGTHTLKATGQNSCGMAVEKTLLITVVNGPKPATPGISGPQLVCLASSSSATYSTTLPPAGTTLSWAATTYPEGNATLSSNNNLATLTWSAPASSAITVQAANASCKGEIVYAWTSAMNPTNQVVTFPEIGAKTYGASSFQLFASSNASLPITYSSSNTAVATIANNMVTIVGAGTTNITATQSGNACWLPGSATQILMVNKAVVTVAAANQTRLYGDVNPLFTFSYPYAEWVNGDSPSVIDTPPTRSTSALQNSNVGTYPITISAGMDNNYTFNYVNASLTITKAPLEVFADAKSKVYGDANPIFTITYIGLKGSDDNSVIDSPPTLSTYASQFASVGVYAIFPVGGSDGNYHLSSYTNGALTIIKALLTITANNKAKTYGAANPVLTVSYSGFKGDDTHQVLDMLPTLNTTATSASSVGMYSITPAGGSDDNYTFTMIDGTLNVSKAPLTVTAANKSKLYGNANPVLTCTYSGWVNDDDTGDISIPSLSTTAVRTYPITLSGGSASNYTFNFAPGVFTVNKASLTITAAGKTKIYGDPNPELTVTYTGFKGSEGIGVLNSTPKIITSAVLASPVGPYTITPFDAEDNNYSFIYVNGTLTITKALLTAKVDDKSKVYGDPNPTLTVMYTGFKGVDSKSSIVEPSLTTAASQYSNVTSSGYPITVAGGSATNYNFAYVNGTLMINKSLLTVTADNKSRPYGDPNPELTISYSGFKGLEGSEVLTTKPTATTTATQSSTVGSHYVISPVGGDDDNYTLSYVSGNMTITKAVLNVTADNKTRAYGEPNPQFTMSYTGFKGLEGVGVLNTPPTATCSAIQSSNAGSYSIIPAAGDDDQYSFNYTNGTLTIGKANQTITFNPISPVCVNGTTNLTASASSGLPITFQSTNTSIASVAGSSLQGVSPGSVAVTANQSGNSNFNAATQQQQTARVTQPAEPYVYSQYNYCVNGYEILLISNPGPYIYTWSTGETGTEIYATAPGSYHVTVNYGSGCIATTYYYVYPCEDPCQNLPGEPCIDPPALADPYPNPADETVTLSIASASEKTTPVNIYDQFGKLVIQELLRPGERAKSINTQNLAAGFYFIQIETAKGIVKKKLMVIHRN